MPDVQYVSDESGNPTAVIVPIELWREIESEKETAYLLKSENMKRRLLEAKERQSGILISILSMFVFMTATGMLAQKGTSIVTRINFARGRTTAVERGSVHRGMSHDYLLKAGAGQTMSVHLAARGGVCFDLYTPGLADSLAQCSKDWSGDLPRSGDYRINVLPDTTTERSIAYTLEVTVR